MLSDQIAIQVHQLSKCYHIYDHPRDRLKQFIFPLLQPVFGLDVCTYYREFKALNNVSFEIKKGEVVGIVGRNGSGKSTLLQIICGTLDLTHGNVQTFGRIAALLELGSGFNPEFTGKENVYMNAAILGLKKDEVDARYDEIVEFASIGEFIDQPVKTYSSGMTVRLAFAVAINVDADILIVDEALSVGDELFQRKCFSRIESIRANGATILFVSHSGGQIVELCDRAILMDQGEMLAVGQPKQIIGRYQKLLYVPDEKRDEIRNQIRTESESQLVQKPDDQPDLQISSSADPIELSAISEELPESFDLGLTPVSTIEYESYGALIKEPMILTLQGEQVNNLIRRRTYRYIYTVTFSKSASNVRFGMMIKTTSGMELGGAASAASMRTSLPYVEAGTTHHIEFHFQCTLNPGVYFLNAGVVGDINHNEVYLHRLVDVAMFRVLSENESLSTGIVDFQCRPVIRSE